MARSARSEMRRSVAALQRLCCLGLGSGAFMPALTPLLHQIIPSSNRQFLQAGSDFHPEHGYFDGPCIEGVSLYLSEFYNERDKDIYMTFPEAMRTRFAAPVVSFQRLRKGVERAVL